MLGLELHRLTRVVDKSEAGGSSTTEGGAHAEDDALLLGGLVHLGELLRELRLGDVGAGGVDDIENHLLPLEQTVGDELASSEGDGRSGVLSGQRRWHRCVFGDGENVSELNRQRHGMLRDDAGLYRDQKTLLQVSCKLAKSRKRVEKGSSVRRRA